MSGSDSEQTERELDHLRAERDLLVQLLELGSCGDPKPFLERALGLIVSAIGARHGYLEIRCSDDPEESPWWIASQLSGEDVARVRSLISHGIVAAALAGGETIETISAQLDDRFSERSSVRGHAIEAVICAPIGGDPSFGVLYLQERAAGGAFSAEDRELVESFARHLAPQADALMMRARVIAEEDPTLPYRKALTLDGVIGRSAGLAGVLRQVALVASLETTVLITGASGTGKSQIARVIHSNSPRASRPFLELNCGALPENLIENELFGHVDGAYTGADSHSDGKVAAAQGGTLFLDEISDLSLHSQSRLLQLLQSGDYFPVGSSDSVRADIRVIAASNRDLEQAVRERSFREDLFYRLEVVTIRMPELRERRSDLPELVEHFGRLIARRHGRPVLECSFGALRALQAAEWPGNHRQLANAIESALIRAWGDGASRLERPHVLPDAAGEQEEPGRPTLGDVARQAQRDLLVSVLAEVDWNVSEAARRLDAARSHVYNLINEFGLVRDRNG